MIGLSVFMTEQRTREIGVRKVLGASVNSIVWLFNLDFSVLVIIANIIAIPVAYYFMNKWLEDFIYRWVGNISSNPVVWIVLFTVAVVSTLIFSFITILWQVYKSANSNSIETLKYE